jgi:hypothetical protein
LILIAYWDLTKPHKQGYQRFEQQSATTRLSPGRLIGETKGLDLYITHIRFRYGDEEGLIISQTEHELTEEDARAIVAGAIDFLGSSSLDEAHEGDKQ